MAIEREDRYEGVRWFAGLINAYAGTLDCNDVPDEVQGPLLLDFQKTILEALMKDEDRGGLLRIVAPDELESLVRRWDEEAKAKLLKQQGHGGHS